MIQIPTAVRVDAAGTLVDLVAAIDLVAAGGATRVIVANAEGLEEVAAEALALAQSAGVRFQLVRDQSTGRPSASVGPREP